MESATIRCLPVAAKADPNALFRVHINSERSLAQKGLAHEQYSLVRHCTPRLYPFQGRRTQTPRLRRHRPKTPSLSRGIRGLEDFPRLTPLTQTQKRVRLCDVYIFNDLEWSHLTWQDDVQLQEGSFIVALPLDVAACL